MRTESVRSPFLSAPSRRLGLAVLTPLLWLCVALAASTAPALAANPEAAPKTPRARMVQGEFQSKADKQAFQQAFAKAFGGEIKIENPEASEISGDGAPNDLFGNSVALSGDIALVGVPQDDIAGNLDQGSAYVFVRIGPAWLRQAKLTASDGAANDYFGTTVALSGDTALVGASNDDIVTGTGTVSNQGSVYVFTRSGTTWTQQQKLTASDGTANDLFGSSLAMSGDTALVGAYGDVGSRGSAYVFIRSGATWSQQATLTAIDGAAGDLFGVSVALSGDSALVGARGDDSSKGSAYVFTRSGTVWSEQAKLTASDGAANDQFGHSVALSGDTAIVGAYFDDFLITTPNNNEGSAYVFTRSGTAWSQQFKLTASDGAAGDNFGASVALSGDTALVGAGYDDITFGDQGSAHVFTRSGSTWTLQQKLVAGDGALGDHFGSSVALSGDTALVGSPFDDNGANTDQGSAYVWARNGTVWSPQDKLSASERAADDYFGYSVALSGDTALVGAYGDNIVFNSDQGSAYVFTRSGATWSLQAKLTASDGAAGDSFG